MKFKLFSRKADTTPAKPKAPQAPPAVSPPKPPPVTPQVRQVLPDGKRMALRTHKGGLWVTNTDGAVGNDARNARLFGAAYLGATVWDWRRHCEAVPEVEWKRLAKAQKGGA